MSIAAYKGNALITGGAINNTTIGATTRSSIAGTTLTANAQVTCTSGVNSSSTVTGALVITGGVGISGNNHIGGSVHITDPTATTSAVTGALIVAGGIGVGDDIYVAGDIQAANIRTTSILYTDIFDTSTVTTMSIGGTNASSLTLGRAAGTVSFPGTVASHIRPSGTHDLGSIIARWDTVYAVNVNASGNLTIGNVISNVIPGTTATYDLGSTLLRFKDIFSSGVTTVNQLSVSSVTSNLIPGTTATYDLGSGAALFKDAYFSGTSLGNVDKATATTLDLGGTTATAVNLSKTAGGVNSLASLTLSQSLFYSSEYINIAGAVNQNPLSTVVVTFLAIGGGASDATGTMPAGTANGQVHIFAMHLQNKNYVLTFGSSSLITPAGGTAATQTATFSLQGASATFVWQAASSHWFVTAASGSVVFA